MPGSPVPSIPPQLPLISPMPSMPPCPPPSAPWSPLPSLMSPMPSMPPCPPPSAPCSPLPSPYPPDLVARARDFRYDLVIVTGVSLAASVLMIMLYKATPRVRRTPGWLMIRAACCELVVSASLLALWVDEPHPEDDRFLLHGDISVIAPLLLCAAGFEIAAHAWRLLMYLEVVATYRNPFEPDRFRNLYPLFVLTVAAAATASMGFGTGVAQTFAESDYERRKWAGLHFLSLAFVYVPFCLFAVCGFFLHSAVRILVSTASRRYSGHDGAPPSISFLARQRVVRHGSAYLLVHGTHLSAALALAVLADQLNEQLHIAFAWDTLLVVICVRPAISLVGWLVINDVMYLYLGICSLTKSWRPTRALPSCGADGATLLRSAEHRCRGALISSEAQDVSRQRGSGSEGVSASSASASREGWQLRAQTLQGIEEVGFKEELRFELLYDVAVGIGELAQHELREEQLAEEHRVSFQPPWRASVDIGSLSHAKTSSAASSRHRSWHGSAPRPLSHLTSVTSSCPSSSSKGTDATATPRPGFPSPPAGRRLREILAATPCSNNQLEPLGSPLLSSGGSAPGSSSRLVCACDESCATSMGSFQVETHPRLDQGTRTVSESHHASLETPPHVPTLFAPLDARLLLQQANHAPDTTPGSGTARDPPSPIAHELSPGLYNRPLSRAAPLSGTPQQVTPLRRSASEGHLGALRAALMDASTPRSHAQHYEVERFRRLRALFGISATAYARAFPDDLTTLGSSWRQRIKESVSEGKSGSFFYRVLPSSTTTTSNEQFASQFIVKQISRAEKQSLMVLLPAYEEYVSKRKGATFIRYLGCHSMTLRWALSGKVYFVVMCNFVPVKPWLAFDLKGATANRRTLAARYLHQMAGNAISEAVPTAATSGMSQARPHRGGYPTLKDWEWMDVAMAVDVSEDDRLQIAQTIIADSQFLGVQGMLDYSLLVGIHRLPASLTQAEQDAQLDALCRAGGYASLERRKVYFFGIIDVLERYNFRWRMQRLVLVAAYHIICKSAAALGISALTPQDYAERFRTFMLYEALGLPRPHLSLCWPDKAGPAQEGRWIRPACGSEAEQGRGLGAIYSMEEILRPYLAYHKWGRLWQRRRRGLVEERIEALRSDYTRRIEFLESELKRRREASGLGLENEEADCRHPRAADGLATPDGAADRAATSSCTLR